MYGTLKGTLSTESYKEKRKVNEMIFTNKYNLPEFVVNALKRDDYEKSGDFSATGLLKSPRQRLLALRHDAEIEMDVSELTWSVLGTAVHTAFERRGNAHDVVVEERMAVPVQTKYGIVQLSGKPDLIDLSDATLYDYKCTSVWAFILGGKPEWEKQLNIYRWMIQKTRDFEIKQIKVCAVYRDWARRAYEEALKKNPFACEYPECNIGIIDVPLVPFSAVESNVIKLIERHKSQEDLPDDKLMLCSDEDRWCRESCWAVKKKGGKRAMTGGLHATQEEAIAFAAKQAVPTEIERRTGRNIKCESYCSGAAFCNQWKAIQEQEGGE
jgi:hypothetical protein